MKRKVGKRNFNYGVSAITSSESRSGFSASVFVYAVFEKKQAKETSIIKFPQSTSSESRSGVPVSVYVSKAIKKRKILADFPLLILILF